MDLLRVFDELHAPLFRFAYRLTGSAADAEDIVQVCFLELLKPDCSYDPARAPLRTWLYGIVRNQSLKRFRTHVIPDLPEFPPPESPETELLRDELEDVVRRAVLELPEGQREVLVLAHYEQMSLAEIASILEIEVGAAKSRLQRARATLKQSLAYYAHRLEKR